jgi:DNA repair protein RadD
MYKLRPYQEDAVAQTASLIKKGVKRIIIRAGTGAGKTIIGARIIHGSQAKNKRVLFLAHRTELITQCSEKLSAMDVYHGIVKSGYPLNASAKVHIASVQTIVNRQHPDPDIIIIDECHHARAASYEKIINRYPNALILGLTATPARTDGKGLGTLFSEIVDVISYTELIEQHYLVPFMIYEPTNIDFKGVETTGGDFNKKQAHERLAKSKIYGDAIEHWQRLSRDRSTILFASCIEDSKRFVESFRAIGVVAEHVDGTTKEDQRKKIFDGFRAGKIQILCNVGVATEGTDLPIASCISLCNPTKSLVLHHQMVGRGLRINDGKQNCIILDHVGNHRRLGWIDDNIQWTLDCQKKAVNKTQGPTAPPIRTCPKCYFAMRGGTNECERCGHVFKVKSREIKQVSGELREATRSGAPVTYRTGKDGLTYYVEKLIEAAEKGYRPGYALGRYRHLFKCYPRFSYEEIEIRSMELRLEKEYESKRT